MKLSILYESRNPKQPTDLSLVAASTKNGVRLEKYPVNFYSGKIGGKSEGKIVLGYHDAKGSFRTTGPIIGIVQSKKDSNSWLIKTENNGSYYYKIEMPENTLIATYNRYLKNAKLPFYTYDQTTNKHINKTGVRNEAVDGWAYWDNTIINAASKPTRKPKTTIEAYNYLLYWAWHNYTNSDGSGYGLESLIEFLSQNKRLHKSIKDIITAFPNANEAAIARLKRLEPTADPESDHNISNEPEPTAEPEPNRNISNEPELDKPELDLETGQSTEEPIQNTSADTSSALDSDPHIDLSFDSDSGSVEMPASDPQQTAPEEASPEVVALNSKKFTKLLTNLLEMDPQTAPKRLRKVIAEFLELGPEPAYWGRCFVDDQNQDLVYRLEDYERLCMVKAFWAGDNRKSNERREIEWSKMGLMMRAFVSSLRNTIDSELTGSRAALNTALKLLINKIRKINPSFYST